MALANQAFQNKKNLVVNNQKSVEIKKQFVRTIVWRVLAYVYEVWTLDKTGREKVNAMGMLI